MFNSDLIEKAPLETLEMLKGMAEGLITKYQKCIEWADRKHSYSQTPLPNKSFLCRLAGEDHGKGANSAFINILPDNKGFNFTNDCFNTKVISPLKLTNYKKYVSTDSRNIEFVSTFQVANEIINSSIRADLLEQQTLLAKVNECMEVNKV